MSNNSDNNSLNTLHKKQPVTDKDTIKKLDRELFGYYWQNSNFPNWGRKDKQ